MGMSSAIAPAPEFTPRFVERCASCPGILPLDGPRVCPSCGRVKTTPRFDQWPIHLRGFLMMKAIERKFVPGMSRQKVWEDLLTGVVAGQHYQGKLYRWAVDPDDCYAPLLKAADAWLAAGKPIPFLT